MKLHLPALLCAAIMANLAIPAIADDGTSNTQATYINVGIATTSNSYTKNNFTYTTTDGTLYVGSNDLVGYFKTEGDPTTLVKTFVDTTLSGNDIGAADVSNFLTIYKADGKTIGDLEISGSGQVYLGGKNGSNFFSGLVANNVTIAKGATGTNLWADSTNLKSFTINDGSAYLRTNWAKGNGTWGNGSTSYKSNTISSGLYINGGFLKMGRQDNGTAVGAGDRNKTNEHFVNILKGEIKQTNGVAQILGKTYISAAKVEQSGGQMQLAYDATAGYDYLRFGNSDTTISQDAANETTDMHIEGKIIYGSNGTGNMKLTIEQKGVGTIRLDNGVMFTTQNADKASKISQSGNGNIYLAGDYSSAIFNIEQSGSGTVNLKEKSSLISNNVAVGTNATLNVDGSMVIKDTATLNGTVKVGATAKLELAETCNIKFGIDSVSDTNGSVQMSETGDLALVGGELELWLSDDALWEMAEDADTLGTEYHLTLISNLSEADMLELESVINDELTLSRYYKELELPTTYDLSAALPVTIEANSLILENNALKAVAIATSPNLTVPEPATATLSLLALVGLASRRRRK